MEVKEERTHKKVVYLKRYVSQNIVLRSSADTLFDYINSRKEPTITIDFSGIQFISAPFTHQYLTNKRAAKNSIDEINRAPDVIQTFEVIERRKRKRK
jgi:hypothetical protein